MRRGKIVLLVLAAACAVCGAIGLAACKTPLLPLFEPEDLRVEEEVLRWEKVKGATGYRVTVDGETTETEFDLYWYFEPRTYRFEVTAIGDGEKYSDSETVSCKYEPRVTVGSTGLEYTLLKDGSGYAVGKGFANLTGTVVIPEFYNGLPVKEIAEYGFFDPVWTGPNGCSVNRQTTGLYLPKTLERISCFVNLVELKSVTVPRSVQFIASDAFMGCTSLAEVKILGEAVGGQQGWLDQTAWYENQKDGPLIVDGKILYGYKGTAPEDGVLDGLPETITSAHMYDYDDFTEIVFPKGIEWIGQMSCDSLSELSLPEGVRYFGGFYSRASMLKKLVLPKGLQYIECIRYADLLEELILPEGLLSVLIGNCASLKRIVIPKGLQKISAFSLDPDEPWEVFFMGNAEESDLVGMNPGTRVQFDWYNYSETRPEEEGNFWHYVDGEIVKW